MSRRLIIVDGVEWRYAVGKDNAVAKNSETGKSITIHLSKLMQMSPYDVDRQRYKRTLHVPPHRIANWIRNQSS